MKSDFINRKYETMFIKDWVNSSSNKNEGIFIFAKSGIGKSRFVSKLFEAEFHNHIKIRVDMPGTTSSSISSYSFLMQLYRKVIQQTEANAKLPVTKRISVSTGLTLANIADINFNLLDKNGYAEQVAIVMSYLSKKFSMNNLYIIGIENFQLVDSESLECLKQLFSIGRQNRFIFEFTMDPNNFSPDFYHIFSEVSSVMECRQFELKYLR